MISEIQFIFKFDTFQPLPAAALSLPTFIVPENTWFFDSEAASVILPIDKFHQWSEDSKPQFGTFEEEFAKEQAKRPRPVRSTPVIPSLFKKREYEVSDSLSVLESLSRVSVRILSISGTCRMEHPHATKVYSASFAAAVQALRSDRRDEPHRDVLSRKTTRQLESQEELPRAPGQEPCRPQATLCEVRPADQPHLLTT